MEQRLGNLSRSKSFIEDFPMTSSGELSRYLYGETMEDVFGLEALKDLDDEKEKYKIALLSKDANDMMNIAEQRYNTFGDTPLSEWGKKYLSDIKRLAATERPGNALAENENILSKKIAALAGLHQRLQAERIALERQRDMPGDDAAGAKAKADLHEVNRLIKEVQLESKRRRSEASMALNTARVDRALRNEHMAEYYERRILSEKERQAMREIRMAEEAPLTEEDIVERGFRDEQDIAEEEQQPAPEGAQQEQKQPPKEKTSKGKEKEKRPSMDKEDLRTLHDSVPDELAEIEQRIKDKMEKKRRDPC